MPRDVCLDVAIPILPAIQNWKQTQTIINLDWSWKIICYRFNWIIICLSIMADSPQAHVCCCGHGFLCICPFLMLVTTSIFTFKGDFLSNFVLILIILNLSLWVLYYTVKLWNAHFWTTLGCSFKCFQRKKLFTLYQFVISKWLKCTENWAGSPLLYLLPPGDVAHWKVANVTLYSSPTSSICSSNMVRGTRWLSLM